MVRVERHLMNKLFWSNDPVMASVFISEDWLLRLKETVGGALKRAVIPVQQYLKTLDPFTEFLNLDGEPPGGVVPRRGFHRGGFAHALQRSDLLCMAFGLPYTPSVRSTSIVRGWRELCSCTMIARVVDPIGTYRHPLNDV